MKKWSLLHFSLLVWIMVSPLSMMFNQPTAVQAYSVLYRIGSSGSGVHELQSRLEYLGYFKGAVTGYFSWKTFWAVKDFQSAFGLKSDGVAGPLTWNALSKATKNWQNSALKTGGKTYNPVSAPTDFGGFSANDINLMSHVVYGEARNQKFDGEVAIAAVIMNRYHNSKFPHSIPGIIFQPGAFASISDGQAWVGSDNLSRSAVLEAIHGWDPTHGALYYWNPAKTTSTWIWSQPILLRIGDHVFAK